MRAGKRIGASETDPMVPERAVRTCRAVRTRLAIVARTEGCSKSCNSQANVHVQKYTHDALWLALGLEWPCCVQLDRRKSYGERVRSCQMGSRPGHTCQIHKCATRLVRVGKRNGASVACMFMPQSRLRFAAHGL